MPTPRDEPVRDADPPSVKPDAGHAADGRSVEEVMHDEAVTERMAPDNASPGEAASG